MASLTLASPEKIGAGSWRYTYSGTAPFRRYVDGVLIKSPTDVSDGNNNDTSIIVTNIDDLYEPPVLEVYDANDTTTIPVQFDNAVNVILQWRGTLHDENYFVVEYYNGSSWIEPVGSSIKSFGNGYYQYFSTIKQSGAVQWRVTSVSDNGDTATPVNFTTVLVGNPDPPSIDITYDEGTNEITVSSR